MKSNRYQNQIWVIKFWRRRWYLWFYFLGTLITIKWLFSGTPRNQWIYCNTGKISWTDSKLVTFKHIWMMCRVHAEIKMNWLYDAEDIL